MPIPPLPADCVLDTNTVLALWLFEDPTLTRLRAAVEGGCLRPIASPPTLEELRRVLAYPQFARAPAQQQALLAAYQGRCHAVVPLPPPLARSMVTLPVWFVWSPWPKNRISNGPDRPWH